MAHFSVHPLPAKTNDEITLDAEWSTDYCGRREENGTLQPRLCLTCSRLLLGRSGLFFPRLFRIRRQDRVQRIAFLARPKLDNPLIADVLNQPVKNFSSQAGARHLATAEKDCRLDFVTFLQKTQHMVLLGLVVVIVHINAEFHFLDRDRLLVLLGLSLLLLLLIQKLPIIHNAANRRLRGGGYLYQVQISFAGHFQRFVRRQDSDLLALVINHANFACANALICADKTLIDTNLRTLFDGVEYESIAWVQPDSALSHQVWQDGLFAPFANPWRALRAKIF